MKLMMSLGLELVLDKDSNSAAMIQPKIPLNLLPKNQTHLWTKYLEYSKKRKTSIRHQKYLDEPLKQQLHYRSNIILRKSFFTMKLEAAKDNQKSKIVMNKRKNKISQRSNHKSKLPHKQPQHLLILKPSQTKNRKLVRHLSPQLVMKS